jgi:hypothetical protein
MTKGMGRPYPLLVGQTQPVTAFWAQSQVTILRLALHTQRADDD